MAQLLKLLGHEVAVVHDGPEGIDKARGHRLDFVLLDIGLPGMDGYEVAPGSGGRSAARGPLSSPSRATARRRTAAGRRRQASTTTSSNPLTTKPSSRSSRPGAMAENNHRLQRGRV